MHQFAGTEKRPATTGYMIIRDATNHHIPQKALGHKTPIQMLKKWQAEKPELFVKRVYNLAGLDINRVPPPRSGLVQR